MNPKLKEKRLESLSTVLPITGIMLFISIFLVPMELGTMVMFLSGAVMLIFGMGFFQLGAEMSMTPIGEGIGVQISKTKRVWLMLLISFIMGLIITVSEPDLQVLADHNDKNKIMTAISEKCGMHSKAKGLVISLPVDSLMGI